MADATVVATYRPENFPPDADLRGCRLHRWSLVADNTDTHDTGLGTSVGIVETAITGTRSASQLEPGGSGAQYQFASGDISIASISDGVVTFSAAGSTLFDLLIWTKD